MAKITVKKTRFLYCTYLTLHVLINLYFAKKALTKCAFDLVKTNYFYFSIEYSLKTLF